MRARLVWLYRRQLSALRRDAFGDYCAELVMKFAEAENWDRAAKKLARKHAAAFAAAARGAAPAAVGALGSAAAERQIRALALDMEAETERHAEEAASRPPLRGGPDEKMPVWKQARSRADLGGDLGPISA